MEHRVAAIASESVGQDDFLRRLASELRDAFQLDAVGVTHPNWQRPMVLLADSSGSKRLDADSVVRVLASATSAATACNVPVWTEQDEQLTSRALHVRLGDTTDASAVLLLYGDQKTPTTIKQVGDLKSLAHYATISREMLLRWPRATKSVEGRALAPTTAAMSIGDSRTLRTFHRDLDLKSTAYRITNESRRLLGADRVSLLIAKRGNFRMTSVSGVAVVDRRANSVKAAEQFVDRVAVLDRPIMLPADEPLPPQIQETLDRYLDETDIASVLFYPLRPSGKASSKDSHLSELDDEPTGEPFAALLVESFSDQRINVTPKVQEVAHEATYAIANSMEHQRIFALPVLKTMGDWFGGRRLPWTALALFVFAALLIASLVVRIDHRIIATGYAESTVQQHVFARSDGTVREVFVADGDRVEKGDLLARLENAELDSRLETLSGQIQTTSKRLASIASMLLSPSTDERQSGRLAIEKRQLESELDGLRRQLELVQRQQQELMIVAPIDGVVAGWQLRRKLINRPLRRGDRLLTVVELDATWQLRLEIPEEDAAEVMSAFEESSALAVTFAAKSNPGSTYAATLESIATAIRKTDANVNVVEGLASIRGDADSRAFQAFYSSQARSGVEATAKITCGRRTVLGSWFGDVADFVDRHILFHVR